MKNQIRVSIIILLFSFFVIGCSVFRSTTQTVNVTCSEPDAKLYLNGQDNKTPFQGEMPRNKPIIIECQKEGYQYASRFVNYKLNTTGVLDTIGGWLVLFPYLGVFTAGAYSLDETNIDVSMFPEPSPASRPQPGK